MDIRFAQQAAARLEEEKPEEAMRLCLEGTRAFPWYATGFLVLGQAYSRQGRVQESLLAYRNALAVQSDNPRLQELIRDAEHELETEYSAFAEQQERRLAGTAEGSTLEDYLRGEESGQGVESSRNGQEAPFVTPTLAEIYVNQGEFKEAIDAYQKLAERRPEQEVRFRERIKQLKDLAQKRGEDGTTPKE